MDDISNEILRQLYFAYFKGKDSFNLDYWINEKNLNKEEIYEAFNYLSNKDLCKMVFPGGICHIKNTGIFQVEDNRLINNNIIEKNKLIRYRIPEIIYDYQKEKNTNLVRQTKIATKLGIPEELFYFHFKIIQDLGFAEWKTANEVTLTQRGFELVKKLKIKKELKKEFEDLKSQNPQKRGKEFDNYMSKLIAYEGWRTESKIKNKGEEIDIYMLKNDKIFLLECKWLKNPVQSQDILIFQGKVNKRASVNGIIISMSGFSKGAKDNIIENIDKSLILPFGKNDIIDIINDKFTFNEKLQRKIEYITIKRELLIDDEIYR